MSSLRDFRAPPVTHRSMITVECSSRLERDAQTAIMGSATPFRARRVTSREREFLRERSIGRRVRSSIRPTWTPGFPARRAIPERRTAPPAFSAWPVTNLTTGRSPRADRATGQTRRRFTRRRPTGIVPHVTETGYRGCQRGPGRPARYATGIVSSTMSTTSAPIAIRCPSLPGVRRT